MVGDIDPGFGLVDDNETYGPIGPQVPLIRMDSPRIVKLKHDAILSGLRADVRSNISEIKDRVWHNYMNGSELVDIMKKIKKNRELLDRIEETIAVLEDYRMEN